MNRPIVLIAVAIVTTAIVAGGVWYWSVSKKEIDLKNTSTQATPEGDKSYTKTTEYYHIDAKYPATARIASTAGKSDDESAVETMENFVQETVQNFTSLQDFENLSDADKQILGFADGRKYELGISYTEYESPKTISFAFALYEDTGGAHPNGYFKTFVWNKSGGQVELSDLFIKGSNYLERLSSASAVQIRKSVGNMSGTNEPALFEEGFAPEEQNFQNFYLHEKELVIVFDPYQVAAYAAGPQVVRIPLSELTDILSSKYK